jgi:hypothetical protein
MANRKNLNDTIRGDRAEVRGYTRMPHDDWDYWDKIDRSAANDGVGQAFNSGGRDDGGSRTYHSFNGGKTSTSSHLKDDYVIGKRCFHDHPGLKMPGTEFTVYGGSCSCPSIGDADVYIGFDAGMKFTARHWPWKKGSEVLFSVPDMGTPKQPAEFKKLVGWAKKQVEAGLKVHCGCVGGHGRTGMFLAALVSEFGEPDAISYVRKNYCTKAVESSSQVKFLGDEFGILKVDAAKSWDSVSKTKKAKGKALVPVKTGRTTFSCVRGNGCIWDAPGG